jgi:hypothetical protein
LATVVVQAFPHEPQLFASVCTFKHVPPQHANPAAHTVPQVPQFLPSVCRSTHVPLQMVVDPDGQTQTPALHVAPAAHAVPQAPQLLVSVWRFTQLSMDTNKGPGVPQPLYPVLHVTPHPPPGPQTVVAFAIVVAQTLPQLPQLFTSEPRSAQYSAPPAPMHSEAGAGQTEVPAAPAWPGAPLQA